MKRHLFWGALLGALVGHPLVLACSSSTANRELCMAGVDITTRERIKRDCVFYGYRGNHLASCPHYDAIKAEHLANYEACQ